MDSQIQSGVNFLFSFILFPNKAIGWALKTRVFTRLRPFLLVVVTLNSFSLHAENIWISDAPVIGDGNYTVEIASGLPDQLYYDNGFDYIDGELVEYYTAYGSSHSIQTFYAPTSRIFHNRASGDYSYTLNLYGEDDTGEETNYSFSSSTITVVSQVPDIPQLNTNSSVSNDGYYYIYWPNVSGANYYETSVLVGGASWQYAKYKSTGGETEIEFDGMDENTYSYQVRSCNDAGCSDYSDIKSITVEFPIPDNVNLPYYQSFESGFDGWVNNSTYNWLRDANGTPSSGTGPSSAKDGNYYMFLETSSGHAYYSNNSAQLCSPFFNANNATVSFSYHMYGANMGTLYLDVYGNGRWYKKILTITGQQQTSNNAAWRTVTQSLAAYSGVIQLCFKGQAAGGYRGDMAIDDIKITTPSDGRRRVTYMHTDLLGSPIEETHADGKQN